MQVGTETAFLILYDCEALATLRFKHLHCHCKNPGVFEDFCVSKTLHLVQDTGLQDCCLNELKGCIEDRSRSKCAGRLVPALQYSFLFCCNVINECYM